MALPKLRYRSPLGAAGVAITAVIVIVNAAFWYAEVNTSGTAHSALFKIASVLTTATVAYLIKQATDFGRLSRETTEARRETGSALRTAYNNYTAAEDKYNSAVNAEKSASSEAARMEQECASDPSPDNQTQAIKAAGQLRQAQLTTAGIAQQRQT